ncbi:MAG TPA: hypothetical protein VMB22_08770 [Verrucomicrobiae bacterium]|nr:hypothetical protein [Verrucomicrobiae bacterium]
MQKWFWLLALGAILAGVSGCKSDEPQNASVRPWDAPQGWENGLGGINMDQHE